MHVGCITPPSDREARSTSDHAASIEYAGSTLPDRPGAPAKPIVRGYFSSRYHRGSRSPAAGNGHPPLFSLLAYRTLKRSHTPSGAGAPSATTGPANVSVLCGLLIYVAQSGSFWHVFTLFFALEMRKPQVSRHSRPLRRSTRGAAEARYARRFSHFCAAAPYSK
jgi:hypothetical protein